MEDLKKEWEDTIFELGRELYFCGEVIYAKSDTSLVKEAMTKLGFGDHITFSAHDLLRLVEGIKDADTGLNWNDN